MTVLLKNALLIFLFLNTFISGFAQQNEEFRMICGYYDQQRRIISQEFDKKIEREPLPIGKIMLKKDRDYFMLKMDSIQNTVLTAALIQVKIKEDLLRITNTVSPQNSKAESEKSEGYKSAEYPGGMNELRKEIGEIFYFDAVHTGASKLSANINFVVERDGSISGVKASGENPVFNRQAEIAVYRLSEKFIPAKLDGESVRSYFRIPFIINFE